MNAHAILIAEDDPFLVKIMGNRLKEEGFEVETANDGSEALEKLREKEYNLLMLDLVMPNTTGFEVLQAMKEEGIKTPAMVFSNLSQDSDREEVLSLGAKGYFVKSDIAIDELATEVKKFMMA